MVEELITTNGGCQLPCWWGIMPGETTWAEAKAFARPFALFVSSPLRDDDYVHYDVYFPISESDRLIGNMLVTFYTGKSDQVVEMIVAGKESSLENILETFGKPDQIWFRSLVYQWVHHNMTSHSSIRRKVLQLTRRDLAL
jgi:hypothetical protein